MIQLFNKNGISLISKSQILQQKLQPPFPLRLRSHFNPQIVDQLPVLVDLQRYLEELSLMSAPSSRAPLILEQIPQYYNDVEMSCKGIVLHRSLSYNPFRYSFSHSTSPNSDFLIRVSVLGKWDDITQKHYKRLFCMSKDKLKQQAERYPYLLYRNIRQTYNLKLDHSGSGANTLLYQVRSYI